MSNRFDDTDLYITNDGDLAISVMDDLATVEDLDYVVQTIISRLRSVASDWFYDNIGADIESFIGKPNTKETSDQLIEKISFSMTKDGFCTTNDFVIIATPVNALTLLIGVFVNTQFSNDPISFTVEVHFLTGIKVSYKQ